ncbi:hypothetical protein FACS1894137_09950 [Spirochaetia bacterium]|nr:hypothetical protein FACS1894137_09950 [Spirochaetia bacterium]
MFKKHFLITRSTILLAVLVLFPLASPAAQNSNAANRFALVIGNNAYRNGIPKLDNPAKDAAAISAALREIGYTVDLKQNIDLIRMEQAIDAFMANLRRDKESEGFFWFAGHGVSTELKKEHHLLPVDADAADDRRIERTGYSVNDLLEQFESVKNKTNVIVLDACRSSLTVQGGRAIGSRGLQVVSAQQVQGNKIVYSTAEGQTAADAATGAAYSPFAQAFLDHIKDPAPFTDVFVDIREDTIRLTTTQSNPRGQRPITLGDFAVKGYSLNPSAQVINPVQPVAPIEPQASPSMAGSATAGDISVSSEVGGTILIDGINTGVRIKAGGTAIIQNVSTGSTTVAVRGDDGRTIQAAQPVMVRQGQTVSATISASQRQAPAPALRQPTSRSWSYIDPSVKAAVKAIASNLPRRGSVVILSIASSSKELSTYLVDDLEYHIASGTDAILVDRKLIDILRTEQDFQISDEDSYDSAVSFGKLLEADVVITGSISGKDKNTRLRVKVLDVKTGTILAMSSEVVSQNGRR